MEQVTITDANGDTGTFELSQIISLNVSSDFDADDGPARPFVLMIELKDEGEGLIDFVFDGFDNARKQAEDIANMDDDFVIHGDLSSAESLVYWRASALEAGV